MSLTRRLERLEAAAPQPPAVRSFERWIRQTCVADPEAGAAYERAMQHAVSRCRPFGGMPTWAEIFELVETDPSTVDDWQRFVASGLQLLLEHPIVPLWMLDLRTCGDHPDAVVWVDRLRALGAEEERWA